MSPPAIGPAARALADRECRAIAAALALQPDVHDAVHRARKTIRRLRALLAVLESRDLETARTDAALRRLGHGLSALRDAHVVVETCQHLAAQQPAPPWSEVCRRLMARRDVLLARALARDPAFARRHAALLRIAGELQAQPWDALSARDLRKGLARSERRTAKAEKRAARTADPQDLHRWRRRVRRLRMQLEAMPALDSALAASVKRTGPGHQARALHALGDQLGRQQDLRMVRNLVRVMPGVPERRGLLAQIDAALAAARG
ncbi:CHAD domain-containing protein [Stenotrophomonas rhizophila]|uniref:CHAD domain-containing protein n=1 Tax=Stenotrophomonas rhizophila TaxID=216778 RepID=A0A498CRX0_9GAMM|nr:CHAD domain-containing protein [Stenotrophomonas rhizophila]RLK56322.1 CHAD domain-containing protein [Stenotrophomonas rhizophila]